MHDNKIYTIEKEEAKKLIAELKVREDVFTIKLDGKKLNTWEQYIKQIEKDYKFPTKKDNFDGYLDWMEDLSWLNKNAFALLIFNHEHLLSQEPKSRIIVMKMFEKIINWWSQDVEKYCMGGESKRI